jgi:hypothetical protein
VCSVSVAAVFFQGPLGREHWPEKHAAVIDEADAELIGAIGEGMVMAPLPASDVVVRRAGNPVVFGVGSFNLTAVPYTTLSAVNAAFFHPGTPESERRRIAREWCVEWVYCPVTWPVSPATLAALRDTPWLMEVASAGGGAVFRVMLFPEGKMQLAHRKGPLGTMSGLVQGKGRMRHGRDAARMPEGKRVSP